ncbi:MAG: DUF799 family lipoprotein [Elusimicrobiales bacterium]|nr:DUF799 family lipoprotein [Elusimicrobiales bacterium]
MRKAALLLPLLLSGCGGYYSVRVPYNLPDMPGAASARPALSSLYLKVVTAPPEPDNALGALAGALMNRQGPEFRPSELGRQAAKALNRPGARVCAWRVDKTGGEDPFTAGLKPAGLLKVEALPPSVSSKKEERSTVYYNKKKQAQTVKNKVWAYSASLYAKVALYALPAMEELDSWSDTFSFTEDRLDNSKDAGDWYADNEGKLYSALTARLTGRYAGRPVERVRPLFAVKKDKESEEALKLAQRNSWNQAEEVWARRAKAAGGWRDHLGLAVAAELKKDYASAGEHYRLAQAAGGSDKDARFVRWAEIFRDLEIFSSTAAAGRCGGEWFGRRTALLPFTDQTTSLDGPPLVRGLVYESLKAAGYDLVPLEETDETLRRRGFSDGGQLAAAKPADIAAWLGADRLIYCDISDFGEIMAGVYNRRMVKGSARIWEAGAGELSFEESVVKVKTPKSFAAGLFTQLAKGLAERIKNKPLAYESALFARQLTENLPNLSK